MCLALPAKVLNLDGVDSCIVELGGIRQKVSLGLLDDVKPGDFVIIHVGYALTKMDPIEAETTLALLRLEGQPTPTPTA
ncbi:MAG: HypC/HybG/HupF family hydrogenase formation chaperone [Myxococcales bacterium]|nr:HypC/HybG/HupF family hydrogenase formation chaperone [Myxococcales bacterium]